MKKQHVDNITDIESLAQSRSFDELSSAEQRLVLDELGSKEDYDRMRLVLAGLSSALPETISLQPREEILRSVHASMERNRRRSKSSVGASIAALVGYRIPLYQAAAFASLLLVVFVLVRGERVQIVPTERVVYLPGEPMPVQVDTEAIVQRVVDSLKDELRNEFDGRTAMVVRRKGEKQRGSGAVHATSMREPRQVDSSRPQRTDNMYVGLANLPQLQYQRRGRSLAEDSAHSRFGVSFSADTL